MWSTLSTAVAPKWSSDAQVHTLHEAQTGLNVAGRAPDKVVH
jgi:hypothetical protein